MLSNLWKWLAAGASAAAAVLFGLLKAREAASAKSALRRSEAARRRAGKVSRELEEAMKDEHTKIADAVDRADRGRRNYFE